MPGNEQTALDPRELEHSVAVSRILQCLQTILRGAATLSAHPETWRRAVDIAKPYLHEATFTAELARRFVEYFGADVGSPILMLFGAAVLSSFD